MVTAPEQLDLTRREERDEALHVHMQAAVERLSQQLSEGHTAEFLSLLRFYSRFWTYSVRNCLLIQLQRPEASRCAGFNQYDVIHTMLLLRDAGPFLVMGSAVGTAMLILWFAERRRVRTRLGGPLALRRWSIERKHLYGGMVFGTGWAITGACPGTAATTLGGGSLMGVVLVVGMVAGIALRDLVVASQEARAIEPVEQTATP